jgi:predicted NUDIX family phosphoesterase
VVGGHVDRIPRDEPISSLFIMALRREVREELGVQELPDLRPVGVVIDSVSLRASRHVGVVYEIVIGHNLTAQAAEEFSLRSKFTGHFFSPEELIRFRGEFDPWSLVLFEDYIVASPSMRVARQIEFPLSLDD